MTLVKAYRFLMVDIAGEWKMKILFNVSLEFYS